MTVFPTRVRWTIHGSWNGSRLEVSVHALESGAETSAVQTLREVREFPAGAKRLQPTARFISRNENGGGGNVQSRRLNFGCGQNLYFKPLTIRRSFCWRPDAGSLTKLSCT